MIASSPFGSEIILEAFGPCIFFFTGPFFVISSRCLDKMCGGQTWIIFKIYVEDFLFSLNSV